MFCTLDPDRLKDIQVPIILILAILTTSAEAGDGEAEDVVEEVEEGTEVTGEGVEEVEDITGPREVRPEMIILTALEADTEEDLLDITKI